MWTVKTKNSPTPTWSFPKLYKQSVDGNTKLISRQEVRLCLVIHFRRSES